MAGFSLFYNNTVTLYNRYFNPETEVEKWYPTVLPNVNLVITRGVAIKKAGTADADTAKLFVDMKRLPKPYLESVAWSQLSDEKKEKHITFTSAEDFFVEGDTTGIKVTESGFFELMKQTRDNVYKVTSADRYPDILPHFEIGGK